MSISVSLKRVTAVAAAIAFVLSAFAVTSASAATCNFTLNHKLGQTGGEIKSIQQFLNANGFAVSASGAGSAGMETSSFGGKTKAAVMAFQAAKGVSPVSGYWGPLTRAAANASCTGGPVVTPTPTPTAGNAVVAAAPQPGNSLAPKSAARVPFTKFTVTAGATPVTLNSVVVERGGLAQDNNFAGLVLLDEMGAQVGNSQTLNSNHQATVGAPVVIPAGATKTFTVAANMASSVNSGEVAVVSVVAVNASGTVAGSLPITGAQHTMNNTLTIGSLSSVTISSFDPSSAQNKNLGDTGVRFAGIRVQAGSAEDIRFWGVRFRLNGSVSASDLANVKVNVDGTDYGATWSTDGRYASAMVPGGLKIEKGFAKDIYVKGDIVGTNASGRVAQFDIDKKTDILFTGELYGYGITPPDGTGTVSTAVAHGSAITNSQPWFQGATVSITGASVTSIAKAAEVPAANVAVNVPNVVLGGFVTDIKGEPLTVQTIPLKVVYSTARATVNSIAPAQQLLTNVSIVDENGAVVSGPSDETFVSNTEGTITLSNSVTFPTGRKVYTIKGKIHQAISAGTITIGTAPKPSPTVLSGWTVGQVPSWSNVTGQVTGNTVVLTTDSFNMNAMTVKAASLAVTQATTPISQTQVAGGTDVHFATFRFDATNSGEDVRFSNIPVTFGTPGNLSSCRVFDGATNLTTGANVISTPASTGTFTLDNSLTVAKGTVKSLDVKCNIVGSAIGSSNIQLTVGAPLSATAINATGVVSNNSVSVAAYTGPSIAMNIGSGAVAISTDASSPSLAIVAGGVTNATIGVWKLRATNENATLQKVGLTLTGGSTQTANLGNVTIWNGSTQVAGPVLMTGTTQAVTLTTPVTLTKDTDVILTIKADTSAVGGSNPGITNSAVKINWDNTAANNQITGAASGLNLVTGPTCIANTVYACGSTSVAGVRLYKSVPTIADDSGTITSTGAADGKLLRFKVTADAKGAISVGKVTVSITKDGTSTVSNLKIFAFTNSSYSTPKSGTSVAGGQIQTTVNAPTFGTLTPNVITAGTPVQVGAGETVYFEVRADVVPATTGASIVTALVGDAAVDPTANTGATSNLVAGGSVSGNFVWSPNTSGTALYTDADWVNGADVVGLPSAGFSKARGL